ncbi:MAG: acyltransferase family protein [Lachnospiraceae bacterium]|nr:acyltransferase family protein [Lachnospiraceae bacterium]
MEEKQAFRKNWIDAAKGIAILIVVLNHSGLHIPGVNFWGGIFYVPIFFLLSGYTYHPTEESFKSFAKKKAHRLLTPYFVTNLILFIIFFVKNLISGSDGDDLYGISNSNLFGGIFYICILILLLGYTYYPTQESLAKKKARWFLHAFFIMLLILFAVFFVINPTLDNIFSIFWMFCIYFSVFFTYRSGFGILYGRSYLFKAVYHGVIEVEEPLMNHLNSPTWFLPALFLVLVCADGIYRKTKGRPKKICLILGLWLLLMLPQYYLGFFLFPWSVDLLPILLIFFFIGYSLSKKKLLEKSEDSTGAKKWGTIAGCLIIALLSALINGSYNLSINDMGRSVVLCIISAMSVSCLLLLFLRWLEKKLPVIVKTLGRLGRHTLTILCWHYFVMQMFFTAVSAVLGSEWKDKGVLNDLMCLAGIVISITACLCLDLIMEKLRVNYRKKVV